MPTHAILGATGNTGHALLHHLSQTSPSTKLHAFCRSKSKFEKLSPTLIQTPNLQIYEGSLTNIPLLTSCLENTDAVYLCVAVPNNVPGTTIAQDTAAAVIAALQQLRDKDTAAKLPRLVVLSSAATEDAFCTAIPAWGVAILRRSESYLYADLGAAEKLLRSLDWVTVVFVKPGGLTVDEGKGWELTTEGMGAGSLPYADLAGGMVEVAGTDRYDGRAVAVVCKGDAKFPWINLWYTFSGLLFHYFPWTYRWIG